MARSWLPVLAALAVAGGAAAQDPQALRASNAAAHALEDARRDVLTRQIEASNAAEQARAALVLRRLDGALDLPLRPSPPPSVASQPVAAEGDPGLSAASERLERLTQEALAQSNARMRAIRPASQPRD